MPSSFISCTSPLPIISRGDIPPHITPRRTYLGPQWQCFDLPWRWLVATAGKRGQELWDVRVNAVVVHQLYPPLPIISRGDIPTHTTPRRTYRDIQWQCFDLPRHSLVATAGKRGQELWDVRVDAVVVHQLYGPPLPIISRGDIPTHTTPRRTYLPIQLQRGKYILSLTKASRSNGNRGTSQATYQDSPMRNRRVQLLLHSPLWQRHFARSPQHRRPSLHSGFLPSMWSWTRSSKGNRRWRCHSLLLSPLCRQCR